MSRYLILVLRTYLIMLLVLSHLEVTQARRFGAGNRVSGRYSHSYPRSGGLLGSQHFYPSSGNSPSYPSTGLSNSSGWHHSYPISGSILSYPSGGHRSHGYPHIPHLSSNKSLSRNTYNIRSYFYSPPQEIQYASPHGVLVSYPVYRGSPPTYVYQYKDCGSKYSSLLAGLALFNLGALTVSYGIGNYRAQPGEVCLFGIKKDNGDYEETRIDCQLISSFIYEETVKQQQQNYTTVTTTVTNTTIVNSTNAQDTPSHVLSPNGTLVTPGAVPDTVDTENATNRAPVPDGTVISHSTIINTTIVNAIDVKGSPIQVTPEMHCYVMRRTHSAKMTKEVPCGVLQLYADKSFKNKTAATIFALAAACAVFYVC